MTVGEIFTSLYTSVNGQHIRRMLFECSSQGIGSIVSKYREKGMEVSSFSDGTVSAVTVRGRSPRCFVIAASCDILPGAICLEAASLLEKAVASGKLPTPENSLCFILGEIPPEVMKKAAGVLFITLSSTSEAENTLENLTLFRSLDITPFPQHALAEKVVSLISQISGIRSDIKDISGAGDLIPALPAKIPADMLSGSISLSPSSLKGTAAFAASVAYAVSSEEKSLAAELSALCCDDWQALCRNKCLEALKLEEHALENRMLRGIRLAAWRDLALSSAASLKDEIAVQGFSDFARKETGAALQLLCGGDVPVFKSDTDKEIVEFSEPEPLGFDGRKTIFEVARAQWAKAPYGTTESWEAFDDELERCTAAAEEAVKNGSARYKKAEVVTMETLKNTLTLLGILPGDRIMVHSSHSSFGTFENGPQGVIQALQECVTTEGLLAMPAFSDCCDGGTAGVFDKEYTPVEKPVGIIPEVFRQTPDVLRSPHPTHSLCAWGSCAQDFLEQKNIFDCFAPDGPWGKLAQRGKIVFLGEAVDGNTFLHACEAWFTGYLDSLQAEVNGTLVNITNYPAHCRGSWYGKGRKAPYFVKLREKGIIREAMAGSALVTVMDAPQLAEVMKEIFNADPAILLHKSGCRECAGIRSRIKKNFNFSNSNKDHTANE